MIKTKVKFGKSKKYGTPSTRQLLIYGEAGQMLAAAIEKRIRIMGVDGFGTRLPKLSDTGYEVFHSSDPRWRGVSGEPLKHSPEFKRVEGGYKGLKQAAGKKGKQDGVLSGSMWDNVAVTIKRTRRGPQIVVGFTKSSVVSEVFVEVSTNIKTRKVKLKAVRTRVENRVKAAQMERDKKTGAHRYWLMSMMRQEVQAVADHVLAQMRWYG